MSNLLPMSKPATPAAHFAFAHVSCEELPDPLALAQDAVLQAEATLEALRCYLPDEDELAGLPRGALAACGTCAAEARGDVVDALNEAWGHVASDAIDDPIYGPLVDRLQAVGAALGAIDATYGWGSAALPCEVEAPAPVSRRLA